MRKILLAILCVVALLFGVGGCVPVEITVGPKTTQGGTEMETSERTMVTTTHVTTTELPVPMEMFAEAEDKK